MIDSVSVLYGRCLHRGALMSFGFVQGGNLICGLHGWDYRYDTGVSEYNNKEVLHKFTSDVEDGWICVKESEVIAFSVEHPQPFQRDEYLGNYADTHPEEGALHRIHLRLGQEWPEDTRTSWPFGFHGCGSECPSQVE